MAKGSALVGMALAVLLGLEVVLKRLGKGIEKRLMGSSVIRRGVLPTCKHLTTRAEYVHLAVAKEEAHLNHLKYSAADPGDNTLRIVTTTSRASKLRINQQHQRQQLNEIPQLPKQPL